MKSWIAILALIAGPASAMSIEDCRTAHAAMVAAVPPVKAVTLAAEVTDDEWCQIVGAPVTALVGAKWLALGDASGFTAQLRKSSVEVPEFGEFAAFSLVEHSAGKGQLVVKTLELARKDGDAARLSLNVSGVDLSNGAVLSAGISQAVLESASFSVSGNSGLVNEVLAQVFRLDAKAARSNFTVAGEQRKVMLRAIADFPAGLGNADARGEFVRMVRAYPNARGVAEVSVPAGASVPLRFFTRFVVLGTKADELVVLEALAEAGLTFRWRD